jgi:flagellar hook-associated protein 3 FlgL
MTAITNSTQAFYRRTTLQMGTLRAQAEDLQNALSTGRRLNRSSDDPVAASRLRMLERADRLGTIDTGNARRAGDDLQLAASALELMGSDIIRARELALWAASTTASDADRSAIASELEQLRLRLMATANSTDTGGNALFGGEASGKAYAIDAAGVISYIGSPASGEIDLGQGQVITRGLTGPEVLSFISGGSPTDIFLQLAGLATALQGGAADPATAARDAMAGLDDALDSLTRSQTVAGSRLAWIEVIQERQVDQSETRATQKKDTGGVDFTGTVAELQQVLTVLEASQAGFTRLAGLSLFNSI